MTAKPRYTVVYFPARGRAEPLRLTLALAGQAFEDVGLNRDEWLAQKAELGLGQLPVLIEHHEDGDVTIPQSEAILRHLARTHGLYGSTERERLAADIAGDTAADVRAKLSALRFSPAWTDEDAKQRYIAETMTVGFARLAKLLGERAWFASNAPTWADAFVFDTLESHLAAWPDCLATYPSLAAFVLRFRAIPVLQDYLDRRRAA